MIPIDDRSNVKATFQRYDRSREGKIAQEDCLTLLRDIFTDWDEHDLSDLMEAAEVDGDGRLDYTLFIDWLYGADATGSVEESNSVHGLESTAQSHPLPVQEQHTWASEAEVSSATPDQPEGGAEAFSEVVSEASSTTTDQGEADIAETTEFEFEPFQGHATKDRVSLSACSTTSGQGDVENAETTDFEFEPCQSHATQDSQISFSCRELAIEWNSPDNEAAAKAIIAAQAGKKRRSRSTEFGLCVVSTKGTSRRSGSARRAVSTTGTSRRSGSARRWLIPVPMGEPQGWFLCSSRSSSSKVSTAFAGRRCTAGYLSRKSISKSLDSHHSRRASVRARHKADLDHSRPSCSPSRYKRHLSPAVVKDIVEEATGPKPALPRSCSPCRHKKSNTSPLPPAFREFIEGMDNAEGGPLNNVLRLLAAAPDGITDRKSVV